MSLESALELGQRIVPIINFYQKNLYKLGYFNDEILTPEELDLGYMCMLAFGQYHTSGDCDMNLSGGYLDFERNSALQFVDRNGSVQRIEPEEFKEFSTMTEEMYFQKSTLYSPEALDTMILFDYLYGSDVPNFVYLSLTRLDMLEELYEQDLLKQVHI